jgi:hypothetical protein
MTAEEVIGRVLDDALNVLPEFYPSLEWKLVAALQEAGLLKEENVREKEEEEDEELPSGEEQEAGGTPGQHGDPGDRGTPWAEVRDGTLV